MLTIEHDTIEETTQMQDGKGKQAIPPERRGRHRVYNFDELAPGGEPMIFTDKTQRQVSAAVSAYYKSQEKKGKPPKRFTTRIMEDRSIGVWRIS